MICGHYTSPHGLQNIVEGEKLWATNIRFLNDEQEFEHAISLTNAVIEKSRQNIDQSRPSNIKYEEYVEAINKSLNTIKSYSSEMIFTTSFSVNKDLLSQWRGYSSEGHGYCIHFDLNKLLQQAQTQYVKVSLHKCIYENDIKKKMLSEILNKNWADFVRSNDKKNKDSVVDKLKDELIILASHFKHPAFEEECEYRLVIHLNEDEISKMRFRIGSNSLIPFIEVSFDKNCIEEISVGPGRNQNLAKKGLVALIEKKYEMPIFLLSVNISESKIPYRT